MTLGPAVGHFRINFTERKITLSHRSVPSYATSGVSLSYTHGVRGPLISSGQVTEAKDMLQLIMNLVRFLLANINTWW